MELEGHFHREHCWTTAERVNLETDAQHGFPPLKRYVLTFADSIIYVELKNYSSHTRGNGLNEDADSYNTIKKKKKKLYAL